MEANRERDPFPGFLASQAGQAIETSLTSSNTSPLSRRARVRPNHARGHAWGLVFLSAAASIAAVAFLISMCSRTQMRNHAFHARSRQLSSSRSEKGGFQGMCGEGGDEEAWITSDDSDSDTEQPLQKRPRLVEEAGEGSELTERFEGSRAAGGGVGVTPGHRAQGTSQGYSAPLRPSKRSPGIAAKQWNKDELEATAALFQLRLGQEYGVRVDQLSGIQGQTLYIHENAPHSGSQTQGVTKLAGKILKLATFVNVAKPAPGPSYARASVIVTGTAARGVTAPAPGPGAGPAVVPAFPPAAGHAAGPPSGPAPRLASGTAAASAAGAATGPAAGPPAGPAAGSGVGSISGLAAENMTGPVAGSAARASSGDTGGHVSRRASGLAAGITIVRAPESSSRIVARHAAEPAETPLSENSARAGHPLLIRHPVIRLPRIGPGRGIVRFNPEAALSVSMAPKCPGPLLCTAHELLRKTQHSVEELITLVTTAEQLVAHSIVYQTRELPPHRPARAAGMLGLRFLIFDCVVSTLHLLGHSPRGEWWDRFTSSVPHAYSNKFLDEVGREEVVFNRQLIRGLVQAIDILKTGERAEKEETIRLEQLLFCSIYSPARFQDRLFDSWRTDLSSP